MGIDGATYGVPYFFFDYTAKYIEKLAEIQDLAYANDIKKISCFLMQRDTNSLAAENSELKTRLQTMEQQVHLKDGKDLNCFSLILPFLSLSPSLFSFIFNFLKNARR